jgi:very-short-patch-repair endonuclease
VECLTEDGYFSIDIALPDQRIALEFDGPSHFMSDGTNKKTMKTKLRDLLLQQRGWRVVSVPYFEWIKLNKETKTSGLKLMDQRCAFVEEKLAGAGGELPSGANLPDAHRE